MSENVQSDTKRGVLEALEACYGIVTDACRKSGIARSTFYEWLKNDPEFKLAVDDIQEVALDFVEGKLFERINGVMIGKHNEDGELKVYEEKPSDQAIALYLKTKGKKRGYVERQEITGADGEVFQPIININVLQGTKPPDEAKEWLGDNQK